MILSYSYDPGVVDVGVRMTNFNLGHIAVFTEDIYLILGTYMYVHF